MAGFLRAHYGDASVETFTVAAVAAWRDQLQAQGLAPSSVAQRVSAVRRLAAAIGADPLVARVRCTQVQQERPSALSDLELSGLLARPDLRTTIGIRDRAILELLARGSQRSGVAGRVQHAPLGPDHIKRLRGCGAPDVVDDQQATPARERAAQRRDAIQRRTDLSRRYAEALKDVELRADKIALLADRDQNTPSGKWLRTTRSRASAVASTVLPIPPWPCNPIRDRP